MGIRLRDWFRQEANEEQLKKVFYNMSSTMKYIHSFDYYISNFNPSEIEINNLETLSPIQYNQLNKMNDDDDQDIINRDIFVLALMQVGVYTNTLDTLNAQFVKENFSEFEIFLPEDDVPYLRGVIQRNSPVYYCDFVNEKNKREIEKLEMESGVSMGEVGGMGIQKKKTTAIGTAMADKETAKLYSGLEEKQAAFTNFLILPLAMIWLGLVVLLITTFII